MELKKTFAKILIWLPSLIILLFFIPNALDKILNPAQTEKVVTSSIVMISMGIYLLIASALFLYHKTMLIGTFLLAFYMTIIAFIHFYKGKPFEVVILIVMSVVFAAYIRLPRLFQNAHY